MKQVHTDTFRTTGCYCLTTDTETNPVCRVETVLPDATGLIMPLYLIFQVLRW